MPTRRPHHEFEEYLALSQSLVAAASKEALVRTARVLAMQAAYYANQAGSDPLRDLERILAADGRDDAGAAFLRDGAKTFVGVLAAVGGVGAATLAPADTPLQ